MASNIQDNEEGFVSGIDVTPLVDVTLVLLIIFMVTAQVGASRAISLEVPRTASGEVVQTIFGLELYTSGLTVIDGKPLTSDEELLTVASQAKTKTPNLRAVIRADATVPHGRVIRVLDLLRQAEISKIAFGVSPTPIPKGAGHP